MTSFVSLRRTLVTSYVYFNENAMTSYAKLEKTLVTFLAEEVSNSRNTFYQSCSQHFERLVNRPVRPMQTILAGFL